MTRIYLGLGSNIDPEANLRLAVRELRRRFGHLDLSTVYRNAAVGFDGPDFHNLVVGFDSDDTPQAINAAIEAIHGLAGRTRGGAKFSSRPLDIDLLLYGDRVIDEPPLRIPRRDVLEYSFVLGPLAELAPDFVHPVSGKTLREHWNAFDRERHALRAVRIDLEG